jgi:hypothetical protein
MSPEKGKGQVGSSKSKGGSPKGSKAKSGKGGCGKGGCSKVKAKSGKGGCGKGGCSKVMAKGSKGGCGKGGCSKVKAKGSKGGCGKGGCSNPKSPKGGSKLPGKGKGQGKTAKKSKVTSSKSVSPKPPAPSKPTTKCPGSPTTFPTANIEMPPDDTCERQCMQWVYQNCVVLDELGEIMEDHCIVPFPFDDDLFGRSLAKGSTTDTDLLSKAVDHPSTVQDKIDYHRKMAHVYEQVLSLID